MNILIVEDEKHNAIRLQQLVAEISDAYHIVGTVSSVEETVQWIKNNAKPDVALMDIRLSDGLSFDIFQQTTVSFSVIFTTAYDEYAIRAFKVNSLDYLLKPIQKEELAIALKKTNPAASQPDMEKLLNLINSKAKIYRKRFLLPAFDGFKTISADDIAFVYFEYKSTRLMLKSGQEEMVSYSLDDLEDELNPDDFFRANRQFIISINSIERILNSFNGKLKVVLKAHPEKEVLVSKEKATKFKEWLNQ
ncbi:LytR/AlgR family response regulator transcription factor [Pedobacter sp. GR22-10]|uniref:LytR/AlgR family response regulator transcription factor n=1 Tax=Pedobacter sp. GR22-10 TaxID=2994472 RepID=UPI0022466FC7|nr:LytTR family DNA-binding domain-containing protein [Pedobacter sp. GR22-10]MCX2429958.1 LytTR family DNA-binding domain-containing protein [Pedobacter sp. GR22-10]